MIARAWAWIRLGVAWLTAHPWAIVAGLGSALAVVFLRRRPAATVSPVIAPDLMRAEQHAGAASELEHRAEHLELQGRALEHAIKQGEERIARAEEPTKPDVEVMTDEEFARLLNDRGL